MAGNAPRLGDLVGDMADFGDAVALCESAGVGDHEAGGVDASRSESEPTTPLKRTRREPLGLVDVVAVVVVGLGLHVRQRSLMQQRSLILSTVMAVLDL